ncbi:hypothetical protein VE01_04576 [Pseudogymnoascus verrucosus]|uniref:Uncharacterized protein n=1 Tax=Pseudogymnoascus verrucosus TaxID=342668 RepID=A0A1B8GNU7_9PEZI|nr:uncharacterized protein VE01_04576 [Pseudogymnoascus verrucosus]OBT97513.1 hypothetical protein VE01_04576 [Pseudogymnoascus verrucosus]
MPFFKSKTADADTVPEEKWIPYRENGEVKYMRASEAQDSGSSGGALRHSKPSAWGNMVAPVGFVAQAPQLLQEKYTDESIIVAIITNVVPAQKPTVVEGKKSFMGKFKKDKEPSTTKAVRMPRREYKKFFAKDKDGKYIGTEPQREWTQEELEDEFGQYQKEV